MPSTNPTPIAPTRIAQHSAMLIFGLSQHYTSATMNSIPSLWARFNPYLDSMLGGAARATYGIIYNSDGSNHFDYLCGIEVPEFPEHPEEFTSLRIAPQTYAVFCHDHHISTLPATFQAIGSRGPPDSGHKAADTPWFERYGEEFDGRTGLGGLEIWVPILG